MKSNKQCRWQKMQIDDSFIKKIEKDSESLLRILKELGADYESHAAEMSRRSDLLFLFFALQIIHIEYKNHLPEALTLCQKMRNICIDYLFGDWQINTPWHSSGKLIPTKQDARKRLFDWAEPFALGIMASLLLKDEQALIKFSEFPGTDLKNNDDDYEIEDIKFLVILANFIRGKPINSIPKLCTLIEKSRHKRPKIMLACLEAIEQRNAKQFIKHFSVYMKLFYDTERKLLGRFISYRGSILWGLAEYYGLDIEEYKDTLMTVKKLDLSTGKIKYINWEARILDSIFISESLGMKNKN
jgi:hypothetical protein